MPTKDIKKQKEKPKISIKFKGKDIFYLIGILVIIFLFYMLLKNGDKGPQKGILEDKYSKIQKIEKKEEKAYSIPPVEKARLELTSSGNTDVIKVLIERNNPDMEYRFQWSINGRVIEDYNRDSISNFKEGDKIGVMVTPIWKGMEGQPRFFSMTVHSTVPKVLGVSEQKVENNVMTFKILTEEKDGLMFFLSEAPSGMNINNKTGEITWSIKDVKPGHYEGKVQVKNSKGAEVVYPFSINLN